MIVLFIGGSGIISSACSELAVKKGYDVYVLNRGNYADRLPKGVHTIHADYSDEAETGRALDGQTFDVVADFRIFTKEDAQKAVRLFKNKTKQYLMISSGTVYKKPLDHYIITEDAPLGNIYSAYARNKIAAENVMREAIQEGFPAVIVRPSLTYSDFFPLTCMHGSAYAIIDRMRKGKEIIVPGDGTSLWTITHNSDFAKGFVGLFGNPKTVGEAFHITQDEVLDWNRIFTILAHAASAEPKIVHIATDFIGSCSPKRYESLAGDHAVSAVFDNSKIKRFVPDFHCTVPFEEGARRVIRWFDEDPKARQIPDPGYDEEIDGILSKYQGL